MNFSMAVFSPPPPQKKKELETTTTHPKAQMMPGTRFKSINFLEKPPRLWVRITATNGPLKNGGCETSFLLGRPTVLSRAKSVSEMVMAMPTEKQIGRSLGNDSFMPPNWIICRQIHLPVVFCVPVSPTRNLLKSSWNPLENTSKYLVNHHWNHIITCASPTIPHQKKKWATFKTP